MVVNNLSITIAMVFICIAQLTSSTPIEIKIESMHKDAFEKAAMIQYAAHVKDADFGDAAGNNQAKANADEMNKIDWSGPYLGWDTQSANPPNETKVYEYKEGLKKMLDAFVHKQPKMPADEKVRMADYLHQLLDIINSNIGVGKSNAGRKYKNPTPTKRPKEQQNVQVKDLSNGDLKLIFDAEGKGLPTVEIKIEPMHKDAFEKAAIIQYAVHVKDADFGDAAGNNQAKANAEKINKIDWSAPYLGWDTQSANPPRETKVDEYKEGLKKMLDAFVHKQPKVPADEKVRMAHYLHQLLEIINSNIGVGKYENPSPKKQPKEHQKIQVKDLSNGMELKLTPVGK